MSQNKLKFGLMPYGTIFNDGKRKFIKIQDYLPSGFKSLNYRQAVNKDGSLSGLLPFNSVDFDGVTATCPDWLEFNVEKLGCFHPNVEQRLQNSKEQQSV